MLISYGSLIYYEFLNSINTRITFAFIVGTGLLSHHHEENTSSTLVKLGAYSFGVYVVNVLLIVAFALLIFLMKGVKFDFVRQTDADWYDALLLNMVSCKEIMNI